MDKWRTSSFDNQDSEPLAPLANLIDIMLVFACGLIAALVAISPDLKQHFSTPSTQKIIHSGKELAEVPKSVQQQMQSQQGYQAMGQVYKDPKTGKLILISQ